MTEDQFEALLFEDEGSGLDFKRDQYRFEGASDEDKAELLKDVLAFANAWRRTDAYILIGVDEVRGGRSVVVGVESHLADSTLQQFVNSKLQRPLSFSYTAMSFEDRQVAVIHVPSQRRPFFLNKDYGKLKGSVVYVRRGSSTATADPDEIASMGRESPIVAIPELAVQFADPATRELWGTSVELATRILACPPEEGSPDYREKGSGLLGGSLVVNNVNLTYATNTSFYREAAEFLRASFRVRPIRFALLNTGEAPAVDVRAELVLEGNDTETFVCRLGDLPDEPARNTFASVLRTPGVRDASIGAEEDLSIERTASGWHIEIAFGNIQPKRTSFSGSALYLGAPASRELKLVGRLFADELPNPLEFELGAAVSVSHEAVTIDELLQV